MEYYQPNVLTLRLLCLLCPVYTPEGDNEKEKTLGDRYIERVNGKLVLRKPERTTPSS
jgi:hypothetical protein